MHVRKSVRHFVELLKLTTVPDHLMCNLNRSGAFTEKFDFVNFDKAFNGNPVKKCLPCFV